MDILLISGGTALGMILLFFLCRKKKKRPLPKHFTFVIPFRKDLRIYPELEPFTLKEQHVQFTDSEQDKNATIEIQSTEIQSTEITIIESTQEQQSNITIMDQKEDTPKALSRYSYMFQRRPLNLYG